MTAITDLIARLEAAAEGSRELDTEIKLAHAAFMLAQGATAADLKASAVGNDLYAEPIPYTSSLDAALTLVPTGYFWECGYSKFVPHNARVAATNTSGGWIGEHDHSRCVALCIAALRARSAQP